MGLAGVPPISLGPWIVSGRLAYAVAAIILLMVTQTILWRIVNSPFGRVLLSIRDDETLSLTSGKNVAVLKTLVFSISSGMASLAGATYAHYMTFIDSSSFTVMDSVFVLSIVIVGGAGSLWGPVLGAVVLVSLPEAFRFLGLPASLAANIRQILYGSALVACMLWRPQGLIGKYAFGRKVRKR